jgi:type VI secretion system protein ImpA
MSDSRAQVDSLLAPLDGDDPCGPDLTYDPKFAELGRVAEGTPERISGDEVIEAEPPDWYDVGERATELLGRTRDLRLVVMLTRFWMVEESFGGLASGLELLSRLCEQYWEGVHPRADEDGDLVLRFNSLGMLVDESFLLGPVRQLPLAQTRQYGVASLRALRVASGRLKLAEESTEVLPDQGALDSTSTEASLEELNTGLENAKRCFDALAALDAAIDANAAGQGPDFKPLQVDLKEAVRYFEDVIARRTGGEVSADGEAGEGATGGGSGPPGSVRSRQDVVRMMDAICGYYRDNEPSSPVPILITRAKKMVNRTFLEIVRDMTPSGVHEIDVFVGPDENQGS